MSFFNAAFQTNEIIVGGRDNSTSGNIVIYDGDDANTIAINAPSVISSSFTLTMPTTDGNVNEVLTTDGTTGLLSWSVNALDTVPADNITQGDAAVSISSTIGNVVLDIPTGANANVVVNSTQILDIYGGATGVVNLAAGLEWQFRDADISISSSAAGKLDLAADSNIYFSGTTMDINGNVFTGNTSVITNLVVNPDIRWQKAGFDLDRVLSDTTMRVAAGTGRLTTDANTINFTTGSGNSVVFNIGTVDSQRQSIARVSSNTYLTLDSSSPGTGVGFRADSTNTVQSKTNSSDSWRIQPPGFPTKIVTFSAGDATTHTAIPSGCAGIKVQAVGAGGGGGAGSISSGSDRGGGGGGGEYMEVYIYESNIGSNLFINASLASGGAGGASGETDGADASESNVCLSITTGVGGTEVCNMIGGGGGTHGNNNAYCGVGGSGGTISIGSGWAISGQSGENGYDRGTGGLFRGTEGRGGNSYLGSGGRPNVRGSSFLGTDGVRGGGGGSGFRDTDFGPGTNGGGAFVIFTFY